MTDNQLTPYEKRTREYYQSFLRVLDKLVEDGPWDKSLFFRVMGKRLKERRDELRLSLEAPSWDDVQHASTLVNRVAKRAGMIEVFIALYCSNGSVLRNWELLLTTIEGICMTRPIYTKENDVKEMIRNKPISLNDAYCKIFIKEIDIAKPFNGKNPTDRMGHELLVLKQGAIRQENIVTFHHEEVIYHWRNGRLLKSFDSE